MQKFNWKYWENIFANTVESISTAAAIQYISPLCASATDKYGDKYVDSTASITRPFILYSSFDFNETNTTIDLCDVCKIWIIPQISMLPILFLYWLQKNYISFSILIKQCFMFVFFLNDGTRLSLQFKRCLFSTDSKPLFHLQRYFFWCHDLLREWSFWRLVVNSFVRNIWKGLSKNIHWSASVLVLMLNVN